MPRFQLTGLAIADLTEIQSYISIEGDAETADRFVDMLFDRFDLLAENRRIGVFVDDFPIEVRRFVCRRYLIYYTPTPYGVEILRVIHSARNLKNSSGEDFLN